MGSIQSKQSLPNKDKFNILDYGYCRVWQRKMDSVQLLQQYPLYIESQQRLKSFQTIWPLRTNNCQFVNVYYFSHSQSSQFCGQLAKGSLFTERIPYRLSQFTGIKYPQLLNIMKNCLEGYSILYEYFGLFLVRSTMIGFTENFTNVKMWVHTDFSQPQPQNPNCRTFQEMFISIINSVESASQVLFYNCPRFSEFIVQTNYLYFSKDFKFLLKGLEDYSKKLNIKCPQNLKNLNQSFIKKPQGWEKFKAKNAIYPKLIQSESVPHSQIHEIISSPQLKMDVEQSQIKQVIFSNSIESASKQQLINLTDTVKRTWSTTNPSHNALNQVQETNDRVFLKPLVNSQNNAYNQRKNSKQNNLDNLLEQKRNQISKSPAKPNNIKCWKGFQKLNSQPFYEAARQSRQIGNVGSNAQNNPGLIRFYSPPSSNIKRMSFNNNQVSNLQFVRSDLSNSVNVQMIAKRTSQRSQQTPAKDFGKQSYDLSTDTKRNHDMSMDSSISLIQDLETKGRLSPHKYKI